MRKLFWLILFLFLFSGCSNSSEETPESDNDNLVEVSGALFTDYAVEIIHQYTPQWEYREENANAWAEDADGVNSIELEKDLLRRWVFTSRDGMEYKKNKTTVLVLWDGITVNSDGKPNGTIIYSVTSLGKTHLSDLRYNILEPFKRSELDQVVSQNEKDLEGEIIGRAIFD